MSAAPRRTAKRKGHVSFVGVGPGDPGLLTVRGRRLIDTADVVVFDPGVPAEILFGARREAELVSTGEPLPGTSEGDSPRPGAVAALLVARAREGQHVVRLQLDDPFVSGTGGAEAEACARARVSFDVVPGVPAATAVPAYAGIPVVRPGISQDVAVISGAVDPAASAGSPDWSALASGKSTVVVVGGGQPGKIAATLVEHGRRGDTPVAVITWGTTGEQRTVVSDLDSVERHAEGMVTSAATVTVIGDVVRLRERLSWWESRPLFGMTVLVPRARGQSAAMSDHLRALGARPVELPTIEIEPPRVPGPMDRAVAGLVSGRYAWVAFTSANAVQAVRERLDNVGLDARVFSGVKIGAVGEATADALRDFGLRADLTPAAAASGEALGAVWPPYDAQLDFLDRVLLPRADLATETLVAAVKAKGWAVDDVTAYRTVRAAPPPPEIRQAVQEGGMDAVVFTASSTVRNLLALAGRPAASTVVACIGPQTAATCRDAGLRVDVEARDQSVTGLVDALAAHVVAQRSSTAPPTAPAPARAAKRPASTTRRTSPRAGGRGPR